MDEFLESITQESLNQLKFIAQQCQDSRVHITDEALNAAPQVIQMVMMHMSKGYHEEEIELVRQQFEEVEADHTSQETNHSKIKQETSRKVGQTTEDNDDGTITKEGQGLLQKRKKRAG